MNKRVEAKRTSKKAKIVKAAKKRGANEFGQRSQVTAPFKTVSTYKPSYTFPPEIKRRTVAEKPDWKEWKYTPQARVWQACALSLDIEPYSIKPNPISWQTGPYADQLFEDESFQSENEKKEFKSRQRILLNNLNSKENSLWFSPNPNRPNLGEVSLPEFAAWCSSVEWPIPEELAALAKKPDTATAIKSEKQDTNLTQSKQESEETSTQDRITDAQNKDKKDALAIAGILLSKGGVLDEVMGLAIQKAESLHNSKVWTELWALSNEPKRPFTSGTKGGGLPYYGSFHGAIKRLNKKAFDKRLARLKKKYL